VQYTRNPDGIAGALKRIGAAQHGSKLDSPNASEFSHMYFSNGVASFFGGIFATHPPLGQRIKRIDPSWDGSYEMSSAQKARAKASRDSQSEQSRDRLGMTHRQRRAQGMAQALGAAAAVSSIGQATPQHVDYASQLLTSIPAPLLHAARQAYSARVVMLSMLLDGDVKVAAKQHAMLDGLSDPTLAKLVKQLEPQVAKLEPQQRMPLAELCIASLRGMSPRQYEAFYQAMEAMVAADGFVSLFEWMLGRMVVRHLAPSSAARGSRGGRMSLASLKTQANVLLSTVAYSGQRDDVSAQAAFEKGWRRLGVGGVGMAGREKGDLASLGQALDRLEAMRPADQQRLVEALVLVIAADREVTTAEAELLRAICDSLGCPMPPLLPGQSLAAN